MTARQGDFFTDPPEHEATRALLDGLLSQSRRYHASADYKALLDFVVRLRNSFLWVDKLKQQPLSSRLPSVIPRATAYTAGLADAGDAGEYVGETGLRVDVVELDRRTRNRSQ